MKDRMRHVRLLGAAAPFLLLAGMASGQGFKDLERQVVEKTLPNGLKVILLPRPSAPVISMVTYADVGGVDENQNATGLAHIFEHMAFKGTTTIGTTDYAKESEAMKREDQVFLALRAERLHRPKPDEAKVKQLEAALKQAEDDAGKYVVPNEIGEIIEREGGQGLNAFTSFDQTVYHYSLPSNKLELWATIEAERFSHPVLREFYKEKDVIMEEKRMGQSQPTYRLLDDFMPVAFKASMYRSFVIGHMSDLRGISRDDAKAWFAKYYGAKNLTSVIVGDVDPATALPMLARTLGRIPPGEKPGPVITEEPPQRAEKRITMEDPSQPFVFIAYHKPAITDPDNAVYDAITDVLAEGRSTRMYKALVKEKKVALATGAFTELGQKYPGLFMFYAVPNKGRTNAECEAAIYEVIEDLKARPVTADELEALKAKEKAKFLDSIDSNMGMAMSLAFAENLEGDWRETFRDLDKIDAVTPADIQRVAVKTFVKSNRTVGTIETVAEKPAEGPAAK
ncbi:MAG TPA: pitrilysin family protein [Thermoanaerobaculaceae bacterium]|nr:pitrilysin family protein [Thermoanaerobaculaceae bacterium]